MTGFVCIKGKAKEKVFTKATATCWLAVCGSSDQDDCHSYADSESPLY